MKKFFPHTPTLKNRKTLTKSQKLQYYTKEKLKQKTRALNRCYVKMGQFMPVRFYKAANHQLMKCLEIQNVIESQLNFDFSTKFAKNLKIH